MQQAQLVTVSFVVPNSLVGDFIADLKETLEFADLSFHLQVGMDVRGVPAKVWTALTQEQREQFGFMAGPER